VRDDAWLTFGRAEVTEEEYEALRTRYGPKGWYRCGSHTEWNVKRHAILKSDKVTEAKRARSLNKLQVVKGG